MFNVGGGELIVIALLALIVLGPQRLPGAARQAGKVLGDLRRLSTGFQNEMRDAFAETESTSAPLRTDPESDRTADASVDAAIGSVSGSDPHGDARLNPAPGEHNPSPKGTTPTGEGA